MIDSATAAVPADDPIHDVELYDGARWVAHHVWDAATVQLDGKVVLGHTTLGQLDVHATADEEVTDRLAGCAREAWDRGHVAVAAPATAAGVPFLVLPTERCLVEVVEQALLRWADPALREHVNA